jgi:hypothetical protein
VSLPYTAIFSWQQIRSLKNNSKLMFETLEKMHQPEPKCQALDNGKNNNYWRQQ